MRYDLQFSWHRTVHSDVDKGEQRIKALTTALLRWHQRHLTLFAARIGETRVKFVCAR